LPALLPRLRYRLWQVWAGWHPKLEERDKEQARRWLNEAAFSLWLRQSPRDQAHSLRVLRRLQKEDGRFPALMAAALLHDVGKVMAPIRLWHRIGWVLVEHLGSRGLSRLTRPRGWRRSFWVLAEHPRLGAALARQAGCDERTVWLIEHHQDDIEGLRKREASREDRLRWLAALQRADNAS